LADISKITLPNNSEYDIKDATARQGLDGKQDKITASGVLRGDGSGNITTANTSQLVRPQQLNGITDPTLQSLVNTVRANRLAFLPASQIIIEKTTDGGTTWEDAGVSDATKTGIFSETRPSISIPKIDGVKNVNCGLRVTITGMKYDVPSNTAETAKYNYWNSSYVLSCERYCQVRDFYFWVSSNSDGISVKIERATGENSNSWATVYDSGSTYALTGWSGCDYVRINQQVFGGGTNQTSNYWNYRLTFFTRNSTGGTTLSTSSTTSAQTIMEIRAYGDAVWTQGNNYAGKDHLYSWDADKNVTFPMAVSATTSISAATYTGFGYGTCSTAEATAAKTATLSDYTLSKNGVISIKFTNSVPANATLSINSKTAKSIYYKGAAITANVIQAGDVATFVYNGSYYHLIAIDRWGSDMGDMSDTIMNRTKIYTGYCSTVAATAQKEVTLDDSTDFALTEDTMVAVRFRYGNTANTPTLKVGSTTAGYIVYPYGSGGTGTAAGDGTTHNSWGDYEVILFRYNGGDWVHSPSQYFVSQVYSSIPTATATSPKMDGTATVGSETTWAKGDHIHPTDTSRQAKITASGILKGDGSGGVTAATAGTDYATTDNKVLQSASTTANWRKLLMHYKDDATSTTAVTSSTDQVYAAVDVSAQPSTGTIRANVYNVNDKVKLQYNSTTQALDFIFI